MPASRAAARAHERRAGRLRADAAHRDAGRDQLMGGARCSRQRCGIEIREHPLGVVELADQQQPSHAEVARVRGVRAVAVRVERRTGGIERACRPAQVARCERDLRFRDDAARTRHGLPGAERACGAAHECARAFEIAELRHRDPAQRERRRIVAQRDAVQRAERVTGRERARGRRDQRIHPNPSESRHTCHSLRPDARH